MKGHLYLSLTEPCKRRCRPEYDINQSTTCLMWWQYAIRVNIGQTNHIFRLSVILANMNSSYIQWLSYTKPAILAVQGKTSFVCALSVLACRHGRSVHMAKWQTTVCPDTAYSIPSFPWESANAQYISQNIDRLTFPGQVCTSSCLVPTVCVVKHSHSCHTVRHSMCTVTIQCQKHRPQTEAPITMMRHRCWGVAASASLHLESLLWMISLSTWISF